MRLAELSPAERRYLSSPLPPIDPWTPRLIERFARTLSARMKQRVQVFPAAPAAPFIESDTTRIAPEMRWDNELEAMWVHARLGGNLGSTTRCTALSRNLLRTLQQVLAETWLSSAQNNPLPHRLRLRIEITTNGETAQQATLTLDFPATPSQMNRWAQGVSAP